MYDSYKAMRRFPGLDGLRCISIVAVMYFHYAHGDQAFGRLGVELFFIISGYLITTLLLRERERTGRISLGGFWMRRVLRIFPIYFGFLLFQVLVVAVVPLDPAMVAEFKSNLPAFLTFTNNWFVHDSDDRRVIFFHAWSLATEEQFYLFWPPLLALLISARAMVLVMVLLITGDVTMTVLLGHGVVNFGPDANALITSLEPTICLGVIVAIMLHYRRSYEHMAPVIARAWFPPVSAALAVVLIWSGAFSLVTHVVMALFVVSVVMAGRHPLRAILGNPAIEFVGRISYGMYIMHMVAVNGVRVLLLPDVPPNSWPVVVCGFILTIAAAALSYYVYEMPFLSLRNRFRPAGSP